MKTPAPLIMLVLALHFVVAPLSAQQKKQLGNGSHFALTSAYNIPMVCYASHDINNPNAAFARSEMGLDMHYGYQLADQFGVVLSVGFGNNRVNTTYINSSGRKQFSYMTFYAGPQYVKRIANGLYVDLRILGGVASVNSPQLVYKNEILLSEARATAFTWTTGIGMKYLFSSSAFLTFRLDHLQMKPAFNVAGDKKNEQHIVLLSPGLGLGVKL